jgi:chromate reductase
VRVITLCGSLHSGSTNRAILAVVARRLRERGIDIDTADITSAVPAFQPQLANEPPASVRRLRAQFERADGIVVAVPEYAGGAPGWVKNVTDWMVGSASLYGRPAVVLSASTSGGIHAIEQMARTLTWQGAPVVSTCRVPAPLTKVSDDLTVTDEATVTQLVAVGDALAGALAADPADVEAMTATTLSTIGVERSPHGVGR